MRSLLEHRALELGERADHLHHHPTRRRRRVDRFGKAAKASLFLLDAIHDREHVAQRAGEAVELPDHKHICFAHLTQQFVQLRTIPPATGGLLTEDDFTTSRFERSALRGGVLITGRDAGVDEQHDCVKVLRRCLIMQYGSATRLIREASMPVSFLSPSQRESYGRYVGDPSSQELTRFFHLDDVDRALISDKRGDANRLGFALQLTTVRYVGTFLEDPSSGPLAVMSTISRQLGIDPSTDLIDYRQGKWRFEHAAQIRSDHGYREFTDRTAGVGLARWLYVQCWTGTERPSALFDRATTWMLAHKVLLPVATPLERFVAKLR